MKCLKVFAFLGLIGVVFGGGLSTCGQITSDFVQLLQMSESRIERLLNFVSIIANNYPGIARSFITFFNCNLNTTNYIIATGLSEISGSNINNILNILNGINNPPFAAPLDCIQLELLSYPVFVRNITSNVIPQLESLAQESPVTPTSNCSSVIQFITYYYQSVTNIANTINDLYSIDLNEFTLIGQQSLYSNFLDDLLICKFGSLVNSIAELTNGNETIVYAYLENQSQSLPPPYNCIQGMIDEAANQVNESTTQFINNITSPSPSSNDRCQPLLGDVEALQNLWNSYMTNMTNYGIENAIQYPVVAPALAASLSCEINIMIDFAANAINSFSGVDSDYISDILNGTVSLPFEPTLDCITNNLIAMRNKIASIRATFIPQIQLMAVPSSVNTSTCSSSYSGLVSYVNILSTLIASKGPYVNDGLNAFTTLDLDEMYLNSMALMLECVPRILGAYGSSALNANPNALIAFVSGNTPRLPYPYSCVRILINIFSSIINQAIVSFSTNQPVDLRIPPIPPYSG